MLYLYSGTGGNGRELETRDIAKAQKTYECRRLETEDPRLRLGLCRGVGADVSGSPMLPFFPTSRSLSSVFHLPKISLHPEEKKNQTLGWGNPEVWRWWQCCHYPRTEAVSFSSLLFLPFSTTRVLVSVLSVKLKATL